MTIWTDASKSGWEAFANGLKVGGVWSSMEKLNISIFWNWKSFIWPYWLSQDKQKIIHLQIDNISPLRYLLKMGWISEHRNYKNFQGNSDVFVEQRRGEYLPSKLNYGADQESQQKMPRIIQKKSPYAAPHNIWRKSALLSQNSVILRYFRVKLRQKCPFLKISDAALKF